MLAFSMPAVAREQACIIAAPSLDTKVTIDLKNNTLHKASKPLYETSNLNFVGFGLENLSLSLEAKDKPLKEVIEKLESEKKIKFIQNKNVLAAYPKDKS
jgi:hypothetical protein